MSQDVFAHAVYGVIVPDNLFKTLTKLVVKAKRKRAKEDEEFDPEFDPIGADYLRDNYYSEWLAIVNRLGVPVESSLVWTGNEDAHPGRSYTDAELWVIGIGVMEFPNDIKFTKKFKELAQWHMWVTAS